MEALVSDPAFFDRSGQGFVSESQRRRTISLSMEGSRKDSVAGSAYAYGSPCGPPLATGAGHPVLVNGRAEELNFSGYSTGKRSPETISGRHRPWRGAPVGGLRSDPR